MCHPEPVMGGAGEDVRAVEQITITTGSELMPAYVSRPDGNDPVPAILIISDVFGASPFYQEMAGRLAHEGYFALLPNLFHRVGELSEPSIEAAMGRAGKLTHESTLADIAAAVDYLQDRRDVQPKQVGTIGFCLGGAYAILIAERSEAIGASCVFYGFPVNTRQSANQPLSPIDEVEKISAPLAGFWGDADAGVGIQNVRRFEEELQRYNKDYEIVIYPGAGHGFMARRTQADVPAAEDAWPKALQFFDKNLRTGASGGAY
ncbi:MAG: dienelactone hydrolase family protein [Dehalococcoidia bacterium]